MNWDSNIRIIFGLMSDKELKEMIEKFAKDNNMEFNPHGKQLLEQFAILLGYRKQ